MSVKRENHTKVSLENLRGLNLGNLREFLDSMEERSDSEPVTVRLQGNTESFWTPTLIRCEYETGVVEEPEPPIVSEPEPEPQPEPETEAQPYEEPEAEAPTDPGVVEVP